MVVCFFVVNKMMAVFLSPIAIVMFTVAILRRAAVEPPNYIIAHEKGFKFQAQPRTGAYSCYFRSAPR